MGTTIASFVDPIRALTHDHAEVTELTGELRKVLARLQRGTAPAHDIAAELAARASTLHDALLSHFSREEEALFPFIVEELPHMAARAESLRSDHDAICSAAAELLRTARLVGSGAGPFSCSAALVRFEDVHARHSTEEIAFLRDVGDVLDATRRAKLRVLLAST